MELILVRHAQPDWTPGGTGVNDPGLTPLGVTQAQLVADRLELGEEVDELFVSTARRAQETAKPISTAVDPTPVDAEWLHEIRAPDDWDGTPAEEVAEHFATARWRSREDWWEGLHAGGESFWDFHARVTNGLEYALAERGVVRHPDEPEHLWQVPEDRKRIVMVAHAGTNSVILGHLLGVAPQPWEWERFLMAHASVTELRTVPISSGHIFSLRRFSDVGHLTTDQITQ